MTVEESQIKSHYMRSIHVGISHNYNFVVAEFFSVVRLPYSDADGDYETFELFRIYYFVKPRPFGVQDFSEDRKDRLDFSVSGLFGTSTCRVAFHDEKLRALCIFGGTVGQLPRQHSPAFQCRFSYYRVARGF